ncbi:uncharacterized protein LOC114194836 [Vigna unguiculata]|uniref:uncharacterized protein LOC114194836 n=1 Tax=Vigna unguiculata TaxID=3917 RepID=UPI0010164CC1|nr:uncharacterized protein LOC114194836 [Vigna unguiculata]
MANKRRRNNARANEIAQAFHIMVDVMKPVVVQPRAMVPPTRPVTMEGVLRHKPSKFSGKLLLMRSMLGSRNCVMVLFDLGDPHSFMSKECVGRLGLVVRDLGCDLIVATLASGQVSTNSMCVGCPIEVVGRRIKVNLICLSLEGLDVILGMD